MAEVQARIYQADAFDRVDFAATLSDIAIELVNAYGQGCIELALDVEKPFELDVGRAMPLGLCYEILLNVVKHAWPERQGGTLP